MHCLFGGAEELFSAGSVLTMTFPMTKVLARDLITGRVLGGGKDES